ncbi:hypothetical protein L1987_59019 [Smallanthus sonchifolius]|uniref:Uncharacterized protein n=1 Tax=Smallanthus sonchifolius TaxID=185202 RepID=A0ACB9D451_9ASTR|nr:hypothetical protein L1987_59019 [Smallanthus sonchifolius]
MSAPCYSTRGWSSNVFVNGFVNWLALKEATRGDSQVNMAFDLDDESYLEHILNVWVTEDYGLVDSWKKVFVVSPHSGRFPPLLIKNHVDEVLIVLNDGRNMLFDAIRNKMQDLETQGSPSTFRALSYTASLALLDG